MGHFRRWNLTGAALLPRCLQARSGKLKARALRHLAAEQLGLTIQEGEHSPVDDARASLYLYLKHRKVGLAGRVLGLLGGVPTNQELNWHAFSYSIRLHYMAPCHASCPHLRNLCLPQEWERWMQQGGKQHQHPAVAQMMAGAAVGSGSRGAAGRSVGGAAGIQLSLAELAKNDYMADL